MRRSLLLSLQLCAWGVLLPSTMASQAPPPVPSISAPLPARWELPLPPAELGRRAGFTLPREARTAGRRINHTVAGLLIGTGLGLVAGYVFYDVICEAVDNRCAGSGVPHLVIGAGLGGALGALLGSLTD